MGAHMAAAAMPPLPQWQLHSWMIDEVVYG